MCLMPGQNRCLLHTCGMGLIVVEPGTASRGVGSVVAVRKLQIAILALTLAAAAGQPDPVTHPRRMECG